MDQRAPRASGEETPREKCRVVVLDDDHDACDLLCDLLARDGCEVRGAHGVDEALQIIAEHEPDLVVTDLSLPGPFQGVDLARVLRGSAATRHVAIIAVTGVIEPEWQLVQYFDAYLRKPVDLDVLSELAQRLADTARAPRVSSSAPPRATR